MPTQEELMTIAIEERKKREEELRKAMEMIQRGIPSQNEPLSLDANQIREYQGRLTKNLDDREALRSYLMNFLEKDMIDPTAPGDPSRDWKFRQTPQSIADEIKRNDRKGKNPVANFFRDIDYALGGGRARDVAAGAAQQNVAIGGLQDLLKDNGLEIGRTMGQQNALAVQLNKLKQSGGKITADIEQRQQMLDDKAAAGARSFEELRRMNDAKIGRMDSQNEMDSWRRQFAPFGVGGSKEMQDAMRLAAMEKAGDTEGADKLRKELQAQRLFNAIVTQGSKPNESQSRTMIHWDKDPQGRTVPIPYSSTTSKPDNPMQKAFRQLMATGGISLGNFSPPQGNTNSVVPQGVAQGNSNKVGQLNEVAQGMRPQSVAPRAVTKALENVQDQQLRQTLATDAIKYKLTPEQIKEDEKDRSLGKRYKIDWNPRAVKGIEGTGGNSTTKAGNLLSTTTRSEISASTNSIMEAAVNGTLDKALGLNFTAGQNVGNKVYGALQSVLPKNIKGFVLGESDDPDYALRRMFPGMGQDEDTMQFRTQFKQFMSSLGFNIQKEATGLQALGQEMDRIKSMLPQGTDDPTVALTSMLTLAVKKSTEGYLLEKGYNKQDVDKISQAVGDFVAPRVSMLKNIVKDAKADYANGKIKNRMDLSKKFNFADLDPDDIIGAALDRKGISFDSIPIQIRRIGKTDMREAEKRSLELPKKEAESQGITGTPLDRILEPILRRAAEETKDKNKMRIVTNPFK